MNKKIIDEVNKLIKKDGLYNTCIDGVKLFKSTKHEKPAPYIYDNWIAFIIQNQKIVKLNDKVFEYNQKKYMVTSSNLPYECETFASKEKPFLAMIVSMKPKVIHQIIDSIPNKKKIDSIESEVGAFTDDVTNKIEDIIYRLICTLESKEEADIFGDDILKELFYRILKGKNSSFLYKHFSQSSNESKISSALKNIHDNYHKELNIPDIARKEDMSTSSFHSHFKKVTEHTPFQYIKKIRLSKAKDLISKEKLNVSEVALKVGYENIPQFSREFKKYFGYPPKEAKLNFEEYSLKKSS